MSQQLMIAHPLFILPHCDENHSGADGKPQDYSILTVTFNTHEEFENWLTEQCERTTTSPYKRSSYAAGTSYT
ncbi:hypothetical protein Aduo_018243 [Ancylostoma duodenale]